MRSTVESLIAERCFVPVYPVTVPSRATVTKAVVNIPPTVTAPDLATSIVLSEFVYPNAVSLWRLAAPVDKQSGSSSMDPDTLGERQYNTY